LQSDKKPEKSSFYESSMMSIILIFFLLVMGAMFVVFVWRLFGGSSGLRVLEYLGIGLGSGIILTIGIVFFTRNKKGKFSRNLLLITTIVILVISLVVSVILKFSINNATDASWAFIIGNSIGLGITSGIAITYMILILFKSPIIFREENLEETPETFVETNENKTLENTESGEKK
jgi:magnesium-transporting ATPase (P-type)